MKSRPFIAPLMIAGLLAACAPQSTPVQEPKADSGLENGSFSAQLNGFTIHYEIHGQGPVVMTLPNSWGLSLDGLRAFYQPLEQRLTMVYFDPRGIGESGAIHEETDMGMAAVRSDFDALRRHLGLERVHALGWSNGAMNLILLAAEYPDSLSSAIFLHGAASFTEEDMEDWAETYPDLMEKYQAFQEETADEAMPLDEKTARLRVLYLEEMFPTMLFADLEAGRAMLREIYQNTEFSWSHSDYANREAPVFDARDKLSQIPTRSLVIAGAHDAMSPEKVRELHHGLADSQFVVFPNSGHFAPVEEPEAFQAAVYEFLGLE